jgi:hydrogenase nickel incorporation protein HypB
MEKKVKVIQVHEGVFAENDRIAAENRKELKKQKTFMINLMASPGAGKSSVLLRTIADIKDKYQIGVWKPIIMP